MENLGGIIIGTSSCIENPLGVEPNSHKSAQSPTEVGLLYKRGRPQRVEGESVLEKERVRP